MPTLEPIRSTFDLHRYVLLRSVLPADLMQFFYDYIRERAATGRMSKRDKQVPGTPVYYGDPVTDQLLEGLRPTVEQLAGLKLYPTYSFYRLYKPGDELARHRDRPACEFSLSINLGQEPSAPWPLWIEGPQGATGAVLQPGDALLYRGIECEHWREPFTGEHMAQVFLHYVDQSGPYKDWKFDKREALGQLPREPEH